jgi:membrane peptidoglycan carboxypeptidase
VIKPFLYLCAAMSGLNGQPFGPDTIIDPAKTPAAQRYTTEGAASATVQLARSDNGAAIAVATELGIRRAKNCIAKLTGTSPVESELIAIGAGKGMELSPLELAAAYTIFSNNGMKVVPKAVAAVYDGERKIEAPEREKTRIVDAEPAFTVAPMLQSVVGDGPDGHYGTAKIARRISGLDATVPLAGKTGTGDNDLWFVGFTPRLVVVVWVGFDNNHPRFEMEKGFTGSGPPLRIWAKFMRDVKKQRPDLLRGSFETPTA